MYVVLLSDGTKVWYYCHTKLRMEKGSLASNPGLEPHATGMRRRNTETAHKFNMTIKASAVYVCIKANLIQIQILPPGNNCTIATHNPQQFVTVMRCAPGRRARYFCKLNTALFYPKWTRATVAETNTKGTKHPLTEPPQAPA